MMRNTVRTYQHSYYTQKYGKILNILKCISHTSRTELNLNNAHKGAQPTYVNMPGSPIIRVFSTLYLILRLCVGLT